MDVRIPTAPRAVHPFFFAVLYLPFGAVGGFLAVALGYELKTKAGVTVAEIGGLVLAALLPNVLKVFWAPVVDTLLNAKVWYLLSVLVVGSGVALIGLLPMNRGVLAYLVPLVLLLNFAATFIGMAADILMAHSTTPQQKGRAGGWSQAGNVGGAGLGGGAGLWLAQHVSPLAASGVLAVAIVCCAAPLVLLPSPSRDHRRSSYVGSLLSVGAEVWAIARSRVGLLVLFVFLLPLGTGVASNFFSPIAGEWKASADVVALVSGVLAGVAAVFGAVVGGYVCDLMERKTAYVLFSLLQAVVVAGMALSPRTPEMFAIFVLAYAACTGMAFGGYAALTLETIGAGAAATKFNLLASVSNVPLFYVAAIEGPVQTRYGSAAMLLTEAGLAVAGALLFGAILLVSRRRGTANR